MKIIYKKADINDIDDIVDFKIKQTLFNCDREGKILKDESLLRKSVKEVLLKELNKTICFFLAIDSSNDKTVACNGVVIHQMIPSNSFINGKKAYITTVYTDEDYRRNGIQDELMNMVLNFLKEIKCEKIELDASYVPAIKLYEKYGFKKDKLKFVLETI